MLASDYNCFPEPDPVEKQEAVHADDCTAEEAASATAKIRRGLDERDRRAYYAEITDRLQNQINSAKTRLETAQMACDYRVSEYRRAVELELGIRRLDRRVRLLQLQLEAQREIEATSKTLEEAGDA